VIALYIFFLIRAERRTRTIQFLDVSEE